MHTRDILDALKQLDVENDAHWTVDGAPRVDALADLGLSGLTREIVTAAAPLFSRTNQELPDIEAMRAAAEQAVKDSEEAARAAKEAKQAADIAKNKLAAVDKAVLDSHTLTRQNQQWIESQNEVQRTRIARGKHIDKLIKDAGGPKMFGKHPVEISEAARIKAARKNYRLPQKPAAR